MAVDEELAADVYRPRMHPPPTIASEAAYLRGRIDWCTGQQWVDELADDLRELRAQVARLAGATIRPLAPCPKCDGPLWPVTDNHDTLAVRCGTCIATYDGLDLLRIGAPTEQGIA